MASGRFKIDSLGLSVILRHEKSIRAIKIKSISILITDMEDQGR